jgi:hypothetical protein
VALNDRGDYGRSLSRWRELFSAHFDTAVFEPFDVDVLRVSLWNLVYFKGRAKQSS